MSATHPRIRRAVFALSLTAMATTAPGGAYAQTFGTDRGACDRSALSQVFSTSTGNMAGSALGAIAGGLLGNQIGRGSGRKVATIGGILAGALVGGAVGRTMAPADQGCVGQALENAPTHRTVAWRNPDSGAAYQVTPTRTYQTAAGTSCRDYTTTATIEGRRETLQGTACRQSDGTWRIKG